MVELQFVRSMKTTHAETNGMEESIQINQNGDNLDDEHLDAVTFDDEPTEPVPIKRTKLDVPAFVQKPTTRVTWKPIEKPKSNEKKLGIESICPNVCFFFLRDDCVEGEKCYDLIFLSIQPDSEVRHALAKCGVKDAARLLTAIVARCPKLLQQYFHVIITYFAEQNSKEQLIQAIAICQREPDKDERFKYFQHLINALISIGEPYATAMEIVFWNLDYDKQKDVVDTLCNMDLVEGIGVSEFLSVFDSLNKKRYRFNKVIINRLMFLCTKSESVLPELQLVDFVRLIYAILRNNKRKQMQKTLNKDCYLTYMQLYHRVRNTNGVQPNRGI